MQLQLLRSVAISAGVLSVMASRMRTLPERVKPALLEEKTETSEGSGAKLLEMAIETLMANWMEHEGDPTGGDHAQPDAQGHGHVELHEAIPKVAHSMKLDEAVAVSRPPPEVLNLVKVEPKKLDKDAVEKAVKLLNDKIEKAQIKLDTNGIELQEFVRKNRKTYLQVQADLVSLSAELANYERMKTKNVASTGKVQEGQEWDNEEKLTEKKMYEDNAARDAPILALRRKDLEVATYMLGLTKCSDEQAASLLQEAQERTNAGRSHRATSDTFLTTVQACEGDNGTKHVFFDNPLLHNSSSQLSEKGREMLQEVLQASQLEDPDESVAAVLGAGLGLTDLEDGDEPEELSFIQRWGPFKSIVKHVKRLFRRPRPAKRKPAKKPAPRRPTPSKRSRRCADAVIDCGVLHDTFSMLYGEMKDAVDELQDQMEEDKAKWTEVDTRLNDDLSMLAEEEGDLGTALGEVVGETNKVLQEQEKKNEQAEQLNKDLRIRGRRFKTVYREILYNEICGTIKVRNALLKNSLGITIGAIEDCAVTGWKSGPCSKSCDDSLEGGVQTLTRQVVVKKKGYGAGCPPLQRKTKCSQIPCPVDCKLSEFSGYSSCSKACGGGVQMRIRSVDVRPQNGGKSCEALQESRTCNSGSCRRDCELGEWTSWSPCSQACDGGVQYKRKQVVKPATGGGECPAYGNDRRFSKQRCNQHKCYGDEVCIAKLDVVLALDGSGSLTEKGFKVLQNFSVQLAQHFKSEAYGHSAVALGAVHFGNGHLTDDGSVSDAEVIHDLSSKIEDVVSSIKAAKFLKGFTNMAQGIMKGRSMLKSSPRKDAHSVLILITDGKPTFKYQTRAAVEMFRKVGKLVVVQIKSFPTESDQTLMKSYVSAPSLGNYILIPGKHELEKDYSKYVIKSTVQVCPNATSPTAEKAEAQARGFRLLYQGKVCAAWPGPEWKEEESPADCAARAENAGKWLAFEFEESNPEFEESFASEFEEVGPAPGKCRVFTDECKEYIDYDLVNVYAPPEEDEEQEAE